MKTSSSFCFFDGKPFEDNQLFADILTVSGFPSLQSFITKYIEGTEPLPLSEMLLKVGLKLENGKISDIENPTEMQLKLRAIWLK